MPGLNQSNQEDILRGTIATQKKTIKNYESIVSNHTKALLEVRAKLQTKVSLIETFKKIVKLQDEKIKSLRGDSRSESYVNLVTKYKILYKEYDDTYKAIKALISIAMATEDKDLLALGIETQHKRLNTLSNLKIEEME